MPRPTIVKILGIQIPPSADIILGQANVFTNVNTFTGIRMGVRAVSSSTSLTTLDFELIADATLGNIDVSLPPAIGSGQWYHVKKIDGTANVVSINADGTDLIDDSISIGLADQWSDAMIIDAAVGYWDQML